MIEIGSNLEIASARVTGRARDCFVKRLAADKFLITPKAPNKTRRLVSFDLRPGNRLLARCEDYYSGEDCLANAHGLLCGHVLKAVQHATQLAKREMRKAA